MVWKVNQIILAIACYYKFPYNYKGKQYVNKLEIDTNQFQLRLSYNNTIYMILGWNKIFKIRPRHVPCTLIHRHRGKFVRCRNMSKQLSANSIQSHYKLRAFIPRIQYYGYYKRNNDCYYKWTKLIVSWITPLAETVNFLRVRLRDNVIKLTMSKNDYNVFIKFVTKNIC